MRIAIIEDEPDIARLYTVILTDAGHQVWHVDQHHLEQVADAEIVIFDVMMPDVDGEAVAGYLALAHPEVRKVAVTAVFHVPPRVRTIADQVLTKPITPDELLDAIGGHG